MDKEDKRFIIFIGIIILIITCVFVQWILSTEEKIIIGEVVDIELYDDYMTVTFNNGESYNINYYGNRFGNVDLTVSSRMRIELQYGDPFFYPNVNDVWIAINIVKVPD